MSSHRKRLRSPDSEAAAEHFENRVTSKRRLEGHQSIETNIPATQDVPTAYSPYGVGQLIGEEGESFAAPQYVETATVAPEHIETATAALDPRAGSYLTDQQAQPSQPLTMLQQSQIRQDAINRLTLLLQKFHSLCGNAHTRNPYVKPGFLLEDDHVVVPIMAVTEAIRSNGGYQMYDVISHTQVNLAKYAPPSLQDGLYDTSLRPRRPLFLTWVYNQEDQRITHGRKTTQGELQAENLGDIAKNFSELDDQSKTHIFLVLVKMEGDVCVLRYYDSYEGLPFRRPKEWPRVLSTIQQVIRNLQWFRDAGNPSIQVTNAVFGSEFDMPAAQQDNAWACGFHTILHAWTVAMNLEPNKYFEPGETFYGMAADVINLVVLGWANSDLIYSFLVGTSFARSTKRRSQCPSFGVLLNIHDIADSNSLENGIRNAHQLQGTLSASLEGSGYPNRIREPGPIGAPRVQQTIILDFTNQGNQSNNQHRGGSSAGNSGQRNQKQKKPSLIDPNVMAHLEFANTDCASVWYDFMTNEKTRESIARDKLPTPETILSFKRIYLESLVADYTLNMSDAKVKQQFDLVRQNFQEALDYESERVDCEERNKLLRMQLGCLRQMARHKPLTLRQKLDLVDSYRLTKRQMAEKHAQLALAQTQAVETGEPSQQDAEDDGLAEDDEQEEVPDTEDREDQGAGEEEE